MHALDWALVQAFVAVAETGSLSGAARKLGLTQPTLSRQVAAQEDSLSVMLFNHLAPRAFRVERPKRMLKISLRQKLARLIAI